MYVCTNSINILVINTFFLQRYMHVLYLKKFIIVKSIIIIIPCSCKVSSKSGIELSLFSCSSVLLESLELTKII